MEILGFLRRLDPRVSMAITAVEGVVDVISDLTGNDEDEIKEAAEYGKDHQQRARAELAELTEARDRLEAFIEFKDYETIVPDVAEQSRLSAQLFAMSLYAEILDGRIQKFK